MFRKGILYKARYIFFILFFFLFYNLGYWSGRKDGLLELHGIPLDPNEDLVNHKKPLHPHTTRKKNDMEQDYFDKNEDDFKDGYDDEPKKTVSEPQEERRTDTSRFISNENEVVDQDNMNDDNNHDNGDGLDDNFQHNNENRDNDDDDGLGDDLYSNEETKEPFKVEEKIVAAEDEENDGNDNNNNNEIQLNDENTEQDSQNNLNEINNYENTDLLDPIVTEPPAPRKIYPPLPAGEKLKVYIVSHRRSGTHLTITTITNNFDNVEVIKQEDHPACDVESMGCERLEELMKTGKVVHAYRDVRDVLVSVYYYQEHIRKKNGKPPSNQTFTEFLVQMPWHPTFYKKMNRVEYWRHHYESWMAIPGIIHLDFEQTVSEPEKTLFRLEEYFQIPLKGDRKPPEEWDKGHTVFFRKGQAGDWVNHFSPKDIEWVDREMYKPLQVKTLSCEAKSSLR